MTTTVLEIPNHRCLSWNMYYAGKVSHWQRTRTKNEIKLLVRAALTGNEELYDGPVHIRVTAVYANKANLIDSDNLIDKLYIDALKGLLIRDDNAKWVWDVTTRAQHGPTDLVRLEIIPVEED